MTRLRKFLTLAPSDRRLLLQSAVLLAAVRLGLWLLPFRTLRRLLGRVKTPTGMPGGGAAALDRVAWAVTKASRYVPEATCLTQALAAQIMLARLGVPARVRIGVARGENAELVAHAWVEGQGQIVVGGSNLERYTPLLALDRE
jgi:hypothetical protein